MVAEKGSAELAEQLIADSAMKEVIMPGMLTLHADRGSNMRSKPVAALLADLGIAKSHSRPYISDDNPYSEAQFKTLKYQPGFPPVSVRSPMRAPLRKVLRLVQPGAPAFGDRHDDTGERPHGPRGRSTQASTGHPAERL